MTVTPAEPRGTGIVPLKSLSLDTDIEQIPGAETVEAEAAGDAAPIPDSPEQQTKVEFDLTPEQVAELVTDVIKAYYQKQSNIEKPQIEVEV
jgi:hypothetical protein